jgi:hypothetical protein
VLPYRVVYPYEQDVRFEGEADCHCTARSAEVGHSRVKHGVHVKVITSSRVFFFSVSGREL